jgi:ADP-heptose:LPS heptosyltransferase
MDKKLQKILQKENPKILITRIDHIGDTLLFTPALSGIRKSIPKSHITAIANEAAYEVLRGNEDLNEIIVFDTKSSADENEKAAFFDRIKSEKFDIIINFSAAVKDYLEISNYGGGYRISPAYRKMLVSRVISPFLMDKTVVCDDDPGEYTKNPQKYKLLHEVEQNFKIASYIGAESCDTRLKLPISDEDKDFALKIIRENLGISEGSPIIAFQISDRWFWEGCREEGMAELLKSLRDKFPDYHILCFGYNGIERIVKETAGTAFNIMGHDTGFVVEQRLECSGEKDGTSIDVVSAEGLKMSFVTGLPLKKFAAALSLCSFIVTMHSGATHISAAVNLPSVVVFNPDYFEYFSYRECPWKVKYLPVKKNYNDNGFAGLDEEQKKDAVHTHIQDIIYKCKDIPNL